MLRSVPTIDLVVLKIASACNLNCTYCYVYNAKDQTYLDRPAQLSEEVASALLARIEAYCARRPQHRISICLHGGEPLLYGQDKLRWLVERMRAQLGDCLGSVAVQTNAVLVDASWARLLRELRVAVSVSLDGGRATNDLVRVDHLGRGTWARTVAGIEQLQREGVRFSVLCVVQPGTSGAAVYRDLRALGVSQLDFLLPDVSHDDWQRRYARFGATPAADYLIPALEAWLAEDNPEVNVRFLGDMFKLILGDSAGTDAFGGGPMPYLIVETDGSIQANDALRVCEQSLGETGLNVLHDGFDDLDRAQRPARDLIVGALARPDACGACPELSTCGGGYLPHRYSREMGFNNPSVWCADILALFRHMRGIVAATSRAGALAP